MPFVGEDEEGAIERVGLETFADECMEAVEAFAHVAGFEGEVDFETAGEAEHE